MSALTSPPPPPPPGTAGGKLVTSNNVNAGILRCPVCSSRMLSTAGTLVELSGEEAVLHSPRPKAGKDDSSAGDEQFSWDSKTYADWWSVPDSDAFDNIGLSRSVVSPNGLVKMVLCSECHQGPFGHQKDGDPRVYLAADLMVQQDKSKADDEVDFKAPESADMEQLRAMMGEGNLTAQFKVTFEEQRLGMMLANAEGGDGVAVVAFTGEEAGPAELSGSVRIGDKVARVNDDSVKEMGYAEVLDMVVGAARPVTILFERPPSGKKSDLETAGTAGGGGEGEGGGGRVEHEEWGGRAAPSEE